MKGGRVRARCPITDTSHTYDKIWIPRLPARGGSSSRATAGSRNTGPKSKPSGPAAPAWSTSQATKR